MTRKKTAVLATVLLVASGLSFSTAAPASAAVTGTCGAAGTFTLKIVQVGSNYKSKMSAASGSSRWVAADVQWRQPYAGAPLNWFNGNVAQGYAYSPGVSTINYPSAMRGFISYDPTICLNTYPAES